MKVVVLGKNGMLGHMVMSYLEKQEGVEVFGTDRVNFDSVQFCANGAAGIVGGRNQSALPILKNADYVINCIGVIKPCIDESDPCSVTNAVVTNSLFPRYMANYCEKHETNFIHITTDCVYSGDTNHKPDEATAHNATDVYGKSKSLGEPDNCMVLRTSIIGPEKNNNRSLLEWVLAQKGDVLGFFNHYWNGMTTLELSRSIYNIMIWGLYEQSLNHIFSDININKLALLNLINDVYELGLNVIPHSTAVVSRSLNTYGGLNTQLQISSLEDQLRELKEWSTK